MNDEEGNIYEVISELLKEVDIHPATDVNKLPKWQDADTMSSKTPAHAILEEEADKEIPVQGSEGG